MLLKRAFDVLVAGAFLLACGPLFLLIAAAIKRESEGPVFFRQERIGRGTKPFSILKFRSMVVNAAAVGPYFTTDGDPRITKVGRFLRRTSLDELPQFVNVLAGDMSLVGPRPDVPVQEQNYTPEQWQERHRVRPGITGLAQATLRSAATHEQRTALDLEYVGKASVVYDIWILLMTVRQVVFRGGN